MCKLIRFVLLSLAVVSCQKALFNNPPRSQSYSGRQSGQKDSTVRQPTGPDAPDRIPDVYATAFCYPEGVDWQSDSTLDARPELVLFKNGLEQLRVPVEGRADAQRHRLSRGHLWTDSCDGREVVVSCDGKERFRYAGDELLRGFLEVNGIVYTLGQRQGREGFSFRINGDEYFSASTGTILGGPEDADWEGGAFSRDSAGVCYSYGIPLRKGEALLWEYHVMREKEEIKNLPAGSVSALYDIRVYEGILYRSELRSSIFPTYCLVKDDTYLTVEMAETEQPHYCKLVPVNGRMCLKGYSTGIPGSKTYAYWLRDPASVLFMAVDNQPILDLLTDGEHCAYLVASPEGSVRTVYLDKENIPFTSDRYSLPSSRCAQFKQGLLALALSNAREGEHLLICNREVTPLKFNGYFTSVQIF